MSKNSKTRPQQKNQIKDLFPGFYRPSEEEFGSLWKNGVFVPDSNVLLNLYRYPEKARRDFLDVLKAIRGRIWVPHQVFLEFQRNRFGVITETLGPITDLKNEMERIKAQIDKIKSQITRNQKRGITGEVDSKFFEEKFTEGLTNLENQLNPLQALQMKLLEIDPIRQELEDLFCEKIGQPPNDQNELDEIYKDGELRYQKEIPPGYLDQPKEQSGEFGEFIFGGLLYKRKFGDLILWKQLIRNAKEQKIERLIFITDDRKEDWWWKEECQGPKTIGPRPELVEEINREGGVKLFYAYYSERFLEYAKKYLRVTIESKSLEQIREISRPKIVYDSPFSLGSPELDAVYEWVYKRHLNSQIALNEYFGPDLEVNTLNGERIGYEIKIVRRSSQASLLNILKKGAEFKKQLEFDRLYLVLVVSSEFFEKGGFHAPAKHLLDEGFDGVYVGMVISESTDACPIEHFKVFMEWKNDG